MKNRVGDDYDHHHLRTTHYPSSPLPPPPPSSSSSSSSSHHHHHHQNQSSNDDELSELEDDEDYIINHHHSINHHRQSSNGLHPQSYRSSIEPHHEDRLSLLPIPVSTQSHRTWTSKLNSFLNQLSLTTRSHLKIHSSHHPIRFISSIIISISILVGILIWFTISTRPIRSFHHDILHHPISASSLNSNHTIKPLLDDLSRISLTDSISGKFSPSHHTVRWLDEAGDGIFSEINPAGIILNDLNSNSTRILIRSDELVDPHRRYIRPESFTVSSDLRYVLVSTDHRQQWRHSKLSHFWIYDTLLKTVQSLRPNLSPYEPSILLARWSPTGHSIAYVLSNDIYLITSPDQVDHPIRLTNTGTSTIFNGVCDWVYEEEVFSSSEALWWSPDSKKLVWLSLDESKVPIYELNVYNPTDRAGQTTPYPSKTNMKYPKPGYSNPIVSVNVFDLESYLNHPGQVEDSITELNLRSAFDDEDRIVMEVAWVSDQELIVRETNRIATREKTGYFDLSGLGQSWPLSPQTNGKVVMDLDFVKFDNGWAEPGQFITPIKAGHDFAPGYLDVRINNAGYRHIAYFSPPDSSRPIFLSHGEWEVDGKISAVNFEKGLVYFIAANPSMERHLYSVRLPAKADLEQLQSLSQSSSHSLDQVSQVTPITSGIGYYDVSFSGMGGFYLLSYQGPLVPWQKLVQVVGPKNQHVDRRLVEDNLYLNRTLSGYNLPTVHYTSVKNSVQQDMNVQEIRPYGMDLSGNTRYPVLFKVYGGPNSQTASKRFAIDWSYFLSSSLDYLVVYVDGRGTGFKGRQFRVNIRNQLGKLEALDVSTAAQYYAGLKYVDPDRIGVWGWSYGGYLTCKTVESYSKDFSMALAVAPVIDWRFYDSVYTERYMSTPELNPTGYRSSAVNHVNGFGNLSFSLAHGSADDNVHFLNSAQLLDLLTAQQIRGFQFRMFSDSDHSISTRGAYGELMRWMTDFLLLKWGHGLAFAPTSNLTTHAFNLDDLL